MKVIMKEQTVRYLVQEEKMQWKPHKWKARHQEEVVEGVEGEEELGEQEKQLQPEEGQLEKPRQVHLLSCHYQNLLEVLLRLQQ